MLAVPREEAPVPPQKKLLISLERLRARMKEPFALDLTLIADRFSSISFTNVLPEERTDGDAGTVGGGDESGKRD